MVVVVFFSPMRKRLRATVTDKSEITAFQLLPTCFSFWAWLEGVANDATPSTSKLPCCLPFGRGRYRPSGGRTNQRAPCWPSRVPCNRVQDGGAPGSEGWLGGGREEALGSRVSVLEQPLSSPDRRHRPGGKRRRFCCGGASPAVRIQVQL